VRNSHRIAVERARFDAAREAHSGDAKLDQNSWI
jgi:hypothetical protein